MQFEAESGVGVAQVVAAGELSSVTRAGSVSTPVPVATGGLSANALALTTASASPSKSADAVSLNNTPASGANAPSDIVENGEIITPNVPTPDSPKPDVPKPDTPQTKPEEQKPEEPKTGTVNINVGWES